jgi:16S rRNA (guanine966-N2)-methyltransferase
LISRGSQARELRIIGGMWRGRRLRFPNVEDVRPTPDRVRETLFNWLASRVPDARCLDLFAGSGALGLEALSRGAAQVVFVERNAVVCRALETILVEWKAPSARVERGDALAYLAGPAERFDIVFVDPPFAAALQASAAALLEERGWLAPGALIYIDSAAREPLPALPPAWRSLKAKRAGEVGYHLFERSGSGAAPA